VAKLLATTSEDELSTQTAIKIEIQDVDATVRNINSSMKASTIMATSTSPTKKSGHGQDVKRITFDESCKKESFDDVNPNYPQISVVVRPPTPLRGDSIKPTVSLLPGSSGGAMAVSMTCSGMLGVRAMNASEIRRHSSHAPGLTVREFDKDKDRRHSGFNPNQLTLDPEHTRFLSSSPAASRRISCGSLFKVSPRASRESSSSLYNQNPYCTTLIKVAQQMELEPNIIKFIRNRKRICMAAKLFNENSKYLDGLLNMSRKHINITFS